MIGKNARGLVALLGMLLSGAAALAADDGLAAGRQAVDEGRFADAKAALAAYVEANAGSAEGLFQLGRAESGLGNHAVGEERIKAAIALDGTKAEYHAQLGTVMNMRAQGMANMFEAGPIFMAAVEKYRKAVALDPDNLHGRIGLCRYYWNAPEIGGGSIKRAKDEAAHVARLNPYLGKVEYALIAQKEGKTEEAIGYFRELLAMKGDEAWAHFELGKLLRGSGRVAEAKASFEAALRYQPEHEGAKAALAGL